MTTPRVRSQLKKALTVTSRRGGLSAERVELSFELLAELEAVESGAPEDPYFAHNVAVLAADLAEAPDTADVAAELCEAAAPLAADGLASDPDDLVLALALSHHAARRPVEGAWLRLVHDACSRPHAGDRLVAAAGAALAARASDAGDEQKAWIHGAAAGLVEKLDAVLARRPEREMAVMARLRLVLLAADAPGAAQREAALSRFRVLAEDADALFGPDAERDRLRLESMIVRLKDKQAHISSAFVEEAVALAERMGQAPTPPVDDIMRLEAALGRRRLLSGDTAQRLLTPLRAAAAAAPEDMAVRAAVTEALEGTGDREELLRYHMDLVRTGGATEASADMLGRQWMRTLESGAPSGLSTETEAWLVDRFPASIARALGPETALLLLERVGSTQGPARAAELAGSTLLRQKRLGRDAALLVRTVQLMADAGQPEKALSIGHAGLAHADSVPLRLTLAKIHIGANIRLAEADPLLRPVAAQSGPAAAEAKALREQVVAHPSFEGERRGALIQVEEKLGIGRGKPVRCRVIFPSDRYALAELPGGKAPLFYQYRHLRVMVTPTSLPEGLGIADLHKGFEFTAEVVGEDDERGDRIRVYWIADGCRITPLAARHAPPEAEPEAAAEPGEEPSAPTDAPPPRVEAPAPEVEAAFHVGTDAPALVRVEKVLARSGLVLGRVLPPDGSEGPPFPVRVGIHRKFLPADIRSARLKRGTVLRCRVGRSPGGPEVRYDALGEVELVSAPDVEAPEAPDPAAEAPAAPSEAPLVSE